MHFWWKKLLETALTMLCCGRKKDENVVDTMGSPEVVNIGGGIGGTDGRIPASGLTVEPSNHGPAQHYDRHSGTGAAHDISNEHGEHRAGKIRRKMTLQEDGQQQPIKVTAGPGVTGRSFRAGNGFDMGIKSIELYEDYTMLETLEIMKRPGQTLGFYIREGNGTDRKDGVFISRVEPGGVVDKNGLLRVGEEIVAVDDINVTRMNLDDVVILISIPRHLMMTVKTKKSCCKNLSMPALTTTASLDVEHPPVYVRRGRSAAGVTSSVGDVMTDRYADDVGMSTGDVYKRRRRLDRDENSEKQTLNHYSFQPRHDTATGTNDLYRWYGPDRIPDEELVYRELPRRKHSEHRSWERPTTTSDQYTEHLGQRPDYSSDTEAQEMREEMPAAWRKRVDAERQHESRAASSRFDYNMRKSKEHRGRFYMTPRSARNGVRRRHSPDIRDVPDRSKMYSSDSEVVDDNLLATDGAIAVEEILRTGNGTNSLPRMTSGQMGARDELRHWLRKLDKLSFELQDFNHHDSVSREIAISQANRTVSQEPTATKDICDSALSYTSDEYKAWLQSRSSIPIVGAKQFIEDGTKLRQHRRGHSLSATSDFAPTHKYGVRSASAEAKHESDNLVYPSQGSSQKGASKSILKSSKPVSYSFSLPPSCKNDSRFYRDESTTQGNASMSFEPMSEQSTVSLRCKPMRIKPYEFRVHATVTNTADVPVSWRAHRDSGGGVDGLIHTHIYCGHGLKAPRTVMRELYCVLSVDSVNRARTGLRSGAINFDWDEDFEVDLHKAQRISFSIYSWDVNTKQTLCYSCSLVLSEFLQHGSQQSLALRLDPTGILYVELLYETIESRFKRELNKTEGAIFGADIERLVAHENTGDNVPIIIRRSIEDIEMRGLESVGLYRLCGSARRQKQLMMQFEADAKNAKLSPTSIPDISVVTGVVKRFLQDLPEPLLTNDLFQMILDAFSVQISNDPAGNAELMFEIIDCLPNSNLATLTYLMKHLKRVLLKSNINKMNGPALAEIFGPLLLYPSHKRTQTTIKTETLVDVVKYLLEIWPSDADERA